MTFAIFFSRADGSGHRTAHSVRAHGLFVLLALTVACSDAPTAPTIAQNLSGQWTGTYTTLACNETGSAISAGFCRAVGTSGGLTFTTSSPSGAITGTLAIGAFNIPVTGTLVGNSLTLTGSSMVIQNFQLAINTWQATVSASSMAGNMTYTIIATVPPIGSVTVSATTALAR